jgi:hypothetical protein
MPPKMLINDYSKIKIPKNYHSTVNKSVPVCFEGIQVSSFKVNQQASAPIIKTD